MATKHYVNPIQGGLHLIDFLLNIHLTPKYYHCTRWVRMAWAGANRISKEKSSPRKENEYSIMKKFDNPKIMKA